MDSEKKFNRWIIVVGAIIVQLCLGAIYAWSVFRIPLQNELGITPTQASLPFSFVLIFFALATILGGKLQDKFGPRIAIIGGILLGLGMILTSFSTSLTQIVIFYGVVSGIGIGVAYVCPISAGIKWFPDKRGLITGLSVAGFGGGALLVGPIARSLIDSMGIWNTFLILGIVNLVLVSIGGVILKNPPVGYKPEGWNPPAAVASKVDFTTGQMLATGKFYLLWIMYFFGCATGLMIIGQTSPIGQELGGYSKEIAAIGVSTLAIFNVLGRILWGRISDSLGRMRTLFLIFLICGLALLTYTFIPTLPIWFWFGISFVGFCFGGYLAVFPAITADFFGTKNVGTNYGFVFTAYGVGGLLSNIFATQVKELTGGYNWAFVVTGILCLAGAILTFMTKPPLLEKNQGKN